MKYGWTWVQGENDNKAMSWIQVSPLSEDGYVEDELCILMHRDRPDDAQLTAAEWDELARQKEAAASFICDALNAYECAP